MEQDVLGADYEAIRLTLDDDAEGEVVATLVRRPCPGSRKAVLYVHGFVDYFFQTHLADFYVEHGYSFYALDLRKYGRSLLDHQTPNFAHAMSDYFPEIDEAVRLIREDNDTLLVNGHSTGGLVTALWADRVRGQGLVDGLFLNSPFLELNVPAGARRTLGPSSAPWRRAARRWRSRPASAGRTSTASTATTTGSGTSTWPGSPPRASVCGSAGWRPSSRRSGRSRRDSASTCRSS
jgi:alpha-beta hydrolase superfamily lysophospholipase